MDLASLVWSITPSENSCETLFALPETHPDAFGVCVSKMQVLEMVMERMASAAVSDLPDMLAYLVRSMTTATKGQVCYCTPHPCLHSAHAQCCVGEHFTTGAGRTDDTGSIAFC